MTPSAGEMAAMATKPGFTLALYSLRGRSCFCEMEFHFWFWLWGCRGVYVIDGQLVSRGEFVLGMVICSILVF
jgi:hypothetical protein